MNPNFDIDNVQTVTFGVGRDDAPDGQPFVHVPADAGVQDALKEMLVETWAAMQRQDDPPKQYEPSEKHARIEFLHIPTNDDLCEPLRDLHNAANLSADTHALDDPQSIYSYFAQFIDGNGKKLTALRRASQFKGILRSQNRLVRLVNDTLQIIADNIFKLDRDFDLLIDDDNVLILRPSGFEFAGKLQQAILDAVPQNIAALTQEIGFVEFGPIQTYATDRSRAARYIASIRSQPNNEKITLNRLEELCKRTGVEIEVRDGRVHVAEKHELAFLELLDRRRYEVDLTEEDPEKYRAASRSRIGGN